MKPFDAKGEYTPEEVKAALAGVDGTRQLSFRYERLDKNNNYIEDIDYVQSCTIDNNALADIKRTAKLDILDTGSINYLQDRIKPYIRIGMPADEGYDKYVSNLSPKVWWKMDDEFKATPTALADVVAASDKTSSDRPGAYSIVSDPTKTVTFRGPVKVADATIRAELWLRIQVGTPDALSLSLYTGQAVGQVMQTEVFYASSVNGTLETELSRTSTTDTPGEFYRLDIPVARLGFYWVRFRPTTSSLANPSVKIYRGSRIEDSSGNNVLGVYQDNTVLGKAGLLGGEGSSIGGAQSNGTADKLDIPFGGPLTFNHWVRFNNSSYWDTDWNVDLGDVHITGYIQSGSNGGAVCTFGLNDVNDPGEYSETITTPLGVDNGVHMLSYVIDTIVGYAHLYCDGVYVGEWPLVGADGYNITDYPEAATDSMRYVSFGLYSDNTTQSGMDDLTIYNKALTPPNINKLYTLGQLSIQDRSGFVEWPQGVFVLSSPSRSRSESGSIYRAVEGYDQLVTLKEDSFDYRYSFGTGTRYTDAVKHVLQSSSPQRTVDLYKDSWAVYGSASLPAADTAILTTTNATQVYVRSNKPYQISGLDVSAKVETPVTGNVLTTIMLTVTDGSRTVTHMMLRNATGSLSVQIGNLAYGLPYNAVTQAYWRIREDMGYIRFEYSADGVNWENFMDEKNTFSSEATAQIVFFADHDAALAGSAMTKIRVKARDSIPTNVTTSTATLPTPMEWEPGTPKLTIINDLLGTINYESATYDENGVFSVGPYISPQRRASEFEYATDIRSVITGEISQTVDLFAIPNKWVVVVSDPDRPALVGSYINDNPASPTSTVSRGRTIVDYRTEQNAPDQLALDGQAERLAFEASQVYEIIEFNTGLMPIHETADVFDLVIDDLEVSNKYAEQSWSMDLTNGATMKHTVRRIVNI